MNNEELWGKFLSALEAKLSSISFETWFREAVFIDFVDNTIVFSVANDYYRSYINNYMADLLEEVCEEISDIAITTKVIIPEEIEKKEEQQEKPVEYIEQMPVSKQYKDINSTLNPNYTFGNFVVGDSNRFPQTCALQVAEQPGVIYNPLFIWGKSGLGKTHLMHAIGNFIQETSDKTVLYVTSETFISDFTLINKKDEDRYELIDHFKDKYRNIDVLMIDDIQFLKGASKTQEEFFNTFNFLHNNNKQIIISSDRSADDLQVFEERLRTRFTWGLTVQINPPDIELKKKILKSKITGTEVGTLIKPEVLEYIANNCESDGRHLEGAVNRLYAMTAMYNPPEINLEFAQMALKDYLHSSIYITNSVAKIAKAVADYYDLTVENLKSKKRTANINKARQIAMYLCKMTTEETIEKIGLEFNRDHSTVIHACNVIEEEYKEKEELREQIKTIKDKIAN